MLRVVMSVASSRQNFGLHMRLLLHRQRQEASPRHTPPYACTYMIGGGTCVLPFYLS